MFKRTILFTAIITVLTGCGSDKEPYNDEFVKNGLMSIFSSEEKNANEVEFNERHYSIKKNIVLIERDATAKNDLTKGYGYDESYLKHFSKNNTEENFLQNLWFVQEASKNWHNLSDKQKNDFIEVLKNNKEEFLNQWNNLITFNSGYYNMNLFFGDFIVPLDTNKEVFEKKYKETFNPNDLEFGKSMLNLGVRKNDLNKSLIVENIMSNESFVLEGFKPFLEEKSVMYFAGIHTIQKTKFKNDLDFYFTRESDETVKGYFDDLPEELKLKYIGNNGVKGQTGKYLPLQNNRNAFNYTYDYGIYGFESKYEAFRGGYYIKNENLIKLMLFKFAKEKHGVFFGTNTKKDNAVYSATRDKILREDYLSLFEYSDKSLRSDEKFINIYDEFLKRALLEVRALDRGQNFVFKDEYINENNLYYGLWLRFDFYDMFEHKNLGIHYLKNIQNFHHFAVKAHTGGNTARDFEKTLAKYNIDFWIAVELLMNDESLFIHPQRFFVTLNDFIINNSHAKHYNGELVTNIPAFDGNSKVQNIFQTLSNHILKKETNEIMLDLQKNNYENLYDYLKKKRPSLIEKYDFKYYNENKKYKKTYGY